METDNPVIGNRLKLDNISVLPSKACLQHRLCGKGLTGQNGYVFWQTSGLNGGFHHPEYKFLKHRNDGFQCAGK